MEPEWDESTAPHRVQSAQISQSKQSQLTLSQSQASLHKCTSSSSNQTQLNQNEAGVSVLANQGESLLFPPVTDAFVKRTLGCDLCGSWSPCYCYTTHIGLPNSTAKLVSNKYTGSKLRHTPNRDSHSQPFANGTDATHFHNSASLNMSLLPFIDPGRNTPISAHSRQHQASVEEVSIPLIERHVPRTSYCTCHNGSTLSRNSANVAPKMQLRLRTRACHHPQRPSTDPVKERVNKICLKCNRQKVPPLPLVPLPYYVNHAAPLWASSVGALHARSPQVAPHAGRVVIKKEYLSGYKNMLPQFADNTQKSGPSIEQQNVELEQQLARLKYSKR